MHIKHAGDAARAYFAAHPDQYRPRIVPDHSTERQAMWQSYLARRRGLRLIAAQETGKIGRIATDDLWLIDSIETQHLPAMRRQHTEPISMAELSDAAFEEAIRQLRERS